MCELIQGYVFVPNTGTAIDRQILRAVEYAKEYGRCRMEFNGVTILVEPTSDVNLLVRDYFRALSGCTDKTVGPHPQVLTDIDRAQDAVRCAENALNGAWASLARHRAELKEAKERLAKMKAQQ